jgi:uncharacterized protein (TIGR01777 family)
MKILIAGASGSIGTALVKALQETHTLTLLGRDKRILKKRFPPSHTLICWEDLPTTDATAFDAIINLCGENIAHSRWNKRIIDKLIQSRVSSNQRLIAWLNQQAAKPHYLCANAVGIYGLQETGDTTPLDEKSPIDLDHPKDVLSQIGISWQQSLLPAIEAGLQVTSTRFGVVLNKDEGMLKKLHLSFSIGLGSVIGQGLQVISWVDIEDVVQAFIFLLNHPTITGAVNITSPHPVSQKEFAKTFAKTLNRPLFLQLPTWFVKAIFGQMGDCLLLKGQRVLPSRLLKQGFIFRYANIADALAHELTKQA